MSRFAQGIEICEVNECKPDYGMSLLFVPTRVNGSLAYTIDHGLSRKPKQPQ